MSTLTINNQTLYYEDSGGSGKPLLFLHGFLFDSTMFESQVKYLSSSYRCICLDTRGFGKTVWDGNAFDLYDIVADCVALLDHLGLDKVVFIGMSQGAYAALRFVIKHPERVEALVLMSTRKDILSEEFNINYAVLRDSWGHPNLRDTLTANLMSLLIGAQDNFGDYWELWRPKWAAFDQNHMFHTINALLAKEIITDDQISGVTVPVFSIHGVEDRGTPVGLADQLYDLFPNGKGKIRVNGAAHAVNMTHADEINPPLRQFLDQYVGGK